MSILRVTSGATTGTSGCGQEKSTLSSGSGGGGENAEAEASDEVGTSSVPVLVAFTSSSRFRARFCLTISLWLDKSVRFEKCLEQRLGYDRTLNTTLASDSFLLLAVLLWTYIWVDGP